MELKQHLIHRKYDKAKARSQITIGEDYSVPDGKPDIASILQKKSEFLVEEVHTEKGKLKIRGMLKVWVLYLAERSGQIADCLEVEFPFDEILYMEGAANGDNLRVDWNIDELRVGIVHPGKLSVRALVTLLANVMGSESHLVTENIENQPAVHVQIEGFSMTEPVIERKDSYRVRDEVLLPVNKPNVGKLLWKDVQVRGLELRMQEGRIALKGEALLLIVYESQEEQGQLQWLEQSVPFQGTLDVTGMTPEMFGIMDVEISHQDLELKQDYDGEMRMLQLELVLDIHMHIYEERICHVLKDAYSTKEQLELQKEEIHYEKLRMCNQTKCRISGKESQNEEGKILQILGHQARLLGKSSKMTEQGILQEGTLQVQMLYVTDSEQYPFGTTTMEIPYSHLIEVLGMQKEDQWKVTESIEQISIGMTDAQQLEVRGILLFHVCVMEQCCLQNITAVTAGAYDLEEYKKRPGMVIHFVQPKETLWSIAKNQRCTMEEIKKLNELTADEIVPGQKLLLLKPVGEAILS